MTKLNKQFTATLKPLPRADAERTSSQRTVASSKLNARPASGRDLEVARLWHDWSARAIG